jgi:hypothetical protein
MGRGERFDESQADTNTEGVVKEGRPSEHSTSVERRNLNVNGKSDISGFAALLDKPVNKKQGTTMNNIQAVRAKLAPLSQVTQLKFSETLRQNLLF